MACINDAASVKTCKRESNDKEKDADDSNDFNLDQLKKLKKVFEVRTMESSWVLVKVKLLRNAQPPHSSPSCRLVRYHNKV